MPDLSSPYLDALRSPEGALTVELRPPRADLSGSATMDAWIDTFHGVRRLARKGRFLFLTDNAVGSAEEENLTHLGANLSEEVDPGSVIPFLTCKHSLDYCLRYAERAWAQGFRALAVLGGDQQAGAPRCVPHAYELRERIRERIPGMALGGWANPHRDAQAQASYMSSPDFTAEFWLSQVVSHHSVGAVEGFLEAAEARGLRWKGSSSGRGNPADRNIEPTLAADRSLPGVFGVFYYRSGNPKTLGILNEFFPVPADALIREFSEGATPEEICARSIRALQALGVRNIYVSNLPMRGAGATLDRILDSF